MPQQLACRAAVEPGGVAGHRPPRPVHHASSALRSVAHCRLETEGMYWFAGRRKDAVVVNARATPPVYVNTHRLENNEEQVERETTEQLAFTHIGGVVDPRANVLTLVRHRTPTFRGRDVCRTTPTSLVFSLN